METSSEELGEILGEEKELDQWNGKETLESESTETLQGVYMAKIISGIDRYHYKKLSALHPGPPSDGVIFFATLLNSNHSLKQRRSPVIS